MRVSTQLFYSTSASQIQQNQRDLLTIQEQISTGRRILRPSDDPVAAQRSLDIQESIKRVEQYNRNADAATARLAIEESALNAASTALQRVRELTLQGKSGNIGQQDRQFIATELRARLDELLQIANSQDANGDYLFSGHRVDTAPFLRSPGGGTFYAGDQGSRSLQIGDNRFIADADNGQSVFSGAKSGNGTITVTASSSNTGSGILGESEVPNIASYNGDAYDIVFTASDTYDLVNATTGTVISTGQAYLSGAVIAVGSARVTLSGTPAVGDTFSVTPSAGISVFDIVEGLATALENGYADPAQQAAFTNTVNGQLLSLDQTIENFLRIQTGIGARMNAIDSQKLVNEDLGLQLTTSLSGIRDVDLTTASIQLSQDLLSLQAAQQAFVRTSGLNLFALL